MCDQTEVVYAPGDVVWVKLGPVWWPSQVQDYDQLPDEITANLRKRPIAVVKFFQEDAFEYVKNLDQIYRYNCRRKKEFIKKGLDMCRSSNRDVPSNMKMFPNDIATAEHLTGGDPNILDEEEFQPEEKEDYSELFGKKSAKKSKVDQVKSWRTRSIGGESPVVSAAKNGRRSLPATVRPVTHPRFIQKALGKGSDHEVRIRSQNTDILRSASDKLYNCHLCGFSASRINVIILHNKSHSAGYSDAFLPPTPTGNKAKKRALNDKRHKTSLVLDKTKNDEPPVKKKSLGTAEDKSTVQLNKSPKEPKDAATASPSKSKITTTSSPTKKPVFGKKRSAKDKAEKAAREKMQTEAFRENLLKDWDDDDDDDDDAGQDDDDNSMSVDQSATNDKSSSESESAKDTPKKDDTKKSTKEISCFDFDDSEDGIKPEETVMQFGRKIPRILGDKKKRKSESDDVDSLSTEVTSQVSEEIAAPEETQETIKEDTIINETSNVVEEKTSEDFDMAFKALLEETVAPKIPDAFANKKINEIILEEETLVTATPAVEEASAVPSQSPEEESKLQTETEEVVVESNESVVSEESKHFLVPTSGEGATTSPDKQTSESKIASCDASSVAPPEFVDDSQQTEEVITTTVPQAVETVTEDDGGNSKETLVNTVENRTTAETLEISSTGEPKCQDFLSNDFVDNCTVDHYSSVEQLPPQPIPKCSPVSKVKKDSTVINKVEEQKEISISNSSNSVGISPADDMQFIVVASAANETIAGSFGKEQNVVTTVSSMASSSSSSSVSNIYQDMDFDIDSMPVIIGDDMMAQEEQLQQGQGTVFQTVETTAPAPVQQTTRLLPMLSTKSSTKTGENKIVTVISSTGQISKMNQNELTQVRMVSGNKKEPMMQQIRIPATKDNRITRKVLLSPTKTLTSQSSAVKISPSTQAGKISVPGLITQKGIVQNAAGAGQVLILKSTCPPGTAPKATLQKMPQVLHHAGGNKVLILTSTQGVPGQKVISTLASPQKNITGTRILTTKGPMVVGGKGSKSCQKILIDKSGAISQAPKSVIIDKSGLLTSVGSSLSKSSTTLLTSCSDSIAPLNAKLTLAGNGKGTAILASSSIGGSKGVILTPVASKGSVVSDNQKLRLIASKSSTPGSSTGTTKLVISNPQSRLLVPSVATKNQQLKLITNSKAQSNSSTILIQTNQGVLATPSFAGAIQKQTKAAKPPALTPKSQIIDQSQKQLVIQQQLQAQNKKLVMQKKPASPNILQKTQRKPAQRVVKKNFLTDQTLTTSTAAAVPSAAPVGATQDVLLLPSMKNMPVVSQGTILQGTTVDAEGRKSYVYLTVDEHGNYRPLETAPVLDFEAASTSEPLQTPPPPPPPPQQQQQQPIQPAPPPPPPQQTLYFDPGTTDLDNLLLAIDEAGNVVNITQQPVTTEPTSNLPLERSGQDILAKALADTQVLQQEPTVAADPVTSSMMGCVFVESLPPAPSLAHNVLETSSTLNQPPIMTPLEVPSAVSSLQTLHSAAASMQPDFLKATDAVAHPSMPLLTEDSDMAAKTAFVRTGGTIDSSSPLAFSLSIGADNNIIVSSSGADISSSLAFMSQATMSTSTTSPQVETLLSQTSAGNVINYGHDITMDVDNTVDAISQQVVGLEQQHSTADNHHGQETTTETSMTSVEQQVSVSSSEVFPVTNNVTFDMNVEGVDAQPNGLNSSITDNVLLDSASIPVSMSIDFQESTHGASEDCSQPTKTDYNVATFNSTVGAPYESSVDVVADGGEGGGVALLSESALLDASKTAMIEEAVCSADNQEYSVDDPDKHR